MREFGIPSKLVRLTEMTLRETHNQIKIRHKISESFETKSGVRQGDGLSTLIFNLCLEKILRNI